MADENGDSEIANLLDAIAKEQGINEYKIKKSQGSMKGDGYLGVITAIEIISPLKSVYLVMKSVIKGDQIRKQIPVAEVYKREIYMYDVCIPVLQEFLASKKLPAFSSFAKCYKTLPTVNNETIILENLRSRGFKLWNRHLPMDEQHVSLVMKTYGRFHALSFALKDQNPDRFQEIARNLGDLSDKFFEKEGLKDMVLKSCNNALEVVKDSGNVEAYTLFSRFVDKLPELIKMAEPSSQHSVILHGDCWTNNMMFKYNDPIDSAATPVQMCFLDLQVARLSIPIYDCSYFFCACSSKSILNNHQYYLDLYYNSLSDYLEELGSNPNVLYPYSVFLDQWKEYAKFGLLMAVMVIKIMLSEQDEVVDFASNERSGASFTDIVNHHISNMDMYKERVKDLVFHFAKSGLL